MNIEWKKKEPTRCPFCTLAFGQGFRWMDNPDVCYVKVENTSKDEWAVNLSSGKMCMFDGEELVTPLAATLVVEEAT